MEGIVGSSFQGGLKAIAETTRLRIIRLLVKHGELCVNDMAKSLGLTQGKISQHLRVMKFQEIVRTRKKSQKIIYSLNIERIGMLVETLRNVFLQID
jgi:DNA-binding transcriptional ArsR family regulator